MRGNGGGEAGLIYFAGRASSMCGDAAFLIEQKRGRIKTLTLARGEGGGAQQVRVVSPSNRPV